MLSLCENAQPAPIVRLPRTPQCYEWPAGGDPAYGPGTSPLYHNMQCALTSLRLSR